MTKVHASKLPPGTWPATLAITPRGNAIISRALHIAINELQRKVRSGKHWPKRGLEEMQDMLDSGIFFNDHDNEEEQ